MVEEGYHWWHSERAMSPSICEYLRGVWYVINEHGAFTEAQLNQRGWEYLGPVTNRPYSRYLDG